MTGINTNSVLRSLQQSAESVKSTQTQNEAVSETGKKGSYGKTVGEPKLSDQAQKYYEQLKKKYGNYDFILVSRDEKENAKANAARYANGLKTVVLIDEDKIERMATDEKYRKQYEGILSGAQTQLSQLKSTMQASGANVQGYGMQVNDNGLTSFFAVLKKSSADQKARIEKNAEKNRTEKKQAHKKAEKKAEKERLSKLRENNRKEIDTEEDTVTISADSIEDLMKKLEEYQFMEKSDNILSQDEKGIGQHIDFRG